MAGPLIEVKFNILRISFEDTTHLRLDLTKYLGHQAYKDYHNNRRYVIEFYLVGSTIICEYDTKDKWLSILNNLDKVLDT